MASVFLDTYSSLLTEKFSNNSKGQLGLFDSNDKFSHFEIIQKRKDITKNKTMKYKLGF